MIVKKYLFLCLFSLTSICLQAGNFKVLHARINYDADEPRQVVRAITDLRHDISLVTGSKQTSGAQIVVGTYGKSKLISELIKKGILRTSDLKNKHENYVITVTREHHPRLIIAGSDMRGTIYGVYEVSRRIGVSPWYWWADIPVKYNPDVAVSFDHFVSGEPSVKYRGIFINDEDWGMKTWASRNFEKELGDIGPKTYDRICELIMRLKGNMLAPAMHSCTGAFYSHPENQKVADGRGVMITTSHCEPLLFNNASTLEWDKTKDGEWNYEVNRENILKKLDDRIRQTAQYDNIYTMGMRGLHDEAMKGSTNPKDRARTLEKVFGEQRAILEKYKGIKVSELPQIFVPYKETLDIYDAGLRVPDDITLVWPDDNYGYMKRVSNVKEQKRKGGSGVYYHLSYCGTPHDYLWLSTTAPQLMYEEMRKAYTAGADRYWLLNVGDIKPMEIETQMFMDMAWNFDAFSYQNANRYQAQWLASVFGEEYKAQFQNILDHYYRLAWDRKPEYMGYEYEWDSKENSRLHDTDFSFETGTAQKRLVEYQDICFAYEAIERKVPENLRPALFELLGYSVLSAYQMNRKFLYAQANHETGNASYAAQSRDANEQLQDLIDRYHSLFGGKWNQMISEIPPGYTALYQNMPELVEAPTDRYRLPQDQIHPEFAHKVDLTRVELKPPFQLLEGMGTDWHVIQMGQPLDFKSSGSISIPITELRGKDSLHVCISVVPMWPVNSDRDNRIRISVDGSNPVVCKNEFIEWGPRWKLQVMENRKEFVLSFPIDKKIDSHILTISIVDPGQMIQKVTYQ